jgi:transcriptional regulator with XRE-family HTH domain
VSQNSLRLAEYLRARRAQLKPEDVGYPVDAGRRVDGLKREEVATLAGISLEYYTRLEQGRDYQVSEQVLTGLTSALRLDSDATTFLYRLARPEPPSTQEAEAPAVGELVLRLVEQWSHVPVYIYDRNQDILMANDLSLALFPVVSPGSNSVMTAFAMDPELRQTDAWKTLARTVVAALRFHSDATDPRLREIVGELSVREPIFRTLWADYDAIPLTSGVVPAYIEGFGIVEFPWQNLNVPGGLFMGVWPASPGTVAFEVLAHLRNELEL